MRLASLFLLFAGSIFAQLHELPDPTLTPGAVATTNESKVCVMYYSRGVRPVGKEWLAIKRRVYRRYGVDWVSGAAEVDHLIPLSIGGSSSLENLWPEPFFDTIWNARVKDDLEGRLHYLVCQQHSLTLEQAQRMISSNWIETYKVIFHTDAPLPAHHRRVE